MVHVNHAPTLSPPNPFSSSYTKNPRSAVFISPKAKQDRMHCTCVVCKKVQGGAVSTLAMRISGVITWLIRVIRRMLTKSA